MRSIEADIGAIKLDVQSIKGALVTRAEIEAMDSRRVSVEQFSGAMAIVNERVTRLETSPQRTYALLGIIFGGIGCLGTVVSVIGVAFTIIWAIAGRH